MLRECAGHVQQGVFWWPYFRIERVDGSTEHVRALRVLRDIEHTVLEGRRDGQWVPELTVPTSQVAGVYQRLTELNGALRWVLVHPTGRSGTATCRREQAEPGRTEDK